MKLFAPMLLLLLLACESDDPVRLQLTPDQREAYQKLATSRIDSMRPVLDSLCALSFEDRVAIATDSIIQRRLEEEARLRARIPQAGGR